MAKETYFWIRLCAAWKSVSTVNTILLASFMAIFGVIVAGLFSPFGLAVFDDTGSAADWFAAVGTWVIGFGAMRLAAGDRDLKLHERREMRLKEAKADRSRLREIASWLVPTQKQVMSVTRRLRQAENRKPDIAHAMLKRLADQIADMEWGSEQQNVVSDPTANVVAKARYVLGRIKDFVVLYDNSLRQIPRDLGKNDKLLEEVLKYANHAEIALKQMQDALNVDAKRFTALIDSLEARIATEDRKLIN